MTNEPPVPDPDDWRTWRREGERLFPPAGTTFEQSFVGMQGLWMALRGMDPDRPRPDRRNVIRVMKKVDGRYRQVRFGRVTNGRKIDIRVRGGFRS